MTFVMEDAVKTDGAVSSHELTSIDWNVSNSTWISISVIMCSQLGRLTLLQLHTKGCVSEVFSSSFKIFPVLCGPEDSKRFSCDSSHDAR